MAKAKINKNEKRRLWEKQQYAQAAEVKIMVSQLPNQHAYDAFLLQQPDVEKRRRMYDFTKGFCRFNDPQFPSPIKIGTILGPDGKPL